MTVAGGSKSKILLCARDLFYLSGYQSTSVDDILRECGVAKSNFYYHFRTKSDLGLAVLELHVKEFETTALAALTEYDRDPAARLAGFCEALVASQSTQHRLGGCPFGNFAAALSVLEEDDRELRFRDLLCEVFDRLQARLAAVLQEGIQCGSFRSDIPVDELAATLVAAIEGLMLMAKTRRSTAPLSTGLPILRLLIQVD